MRKLLLIFALLCSASLCFGSATNIYITPTGSPIGNCTTGQQPPSFVTTSGNWGAGAGQIGAGTTVLFCGTFTIGTGGTLATFLGGGTVNNPVTFKLDTNAIIQSPAMGGANAGAFNCANKTFVSVVSDKTGIIQNTANIAGTSLHQASQGLYFQGCIHVVVDQIIIQHIFDNNGGTDNGGDNTADIFFNGAATSNQVTNSVLTGAREGILVDFEPAVDASGFLSRNNTYTDHAAGIFFGSCNSGATATGVVFDKDTLSNWSNWWGNPSVIHTDGYIVFNDAGPGNSSSCTTAAVPLATYTMSNSKFVGSLGPNNGAPTGYIACGTNSTCTIFNDVMDDSASSNANNGYIWLYSPNGADTIDSVTLLGSTFAGNICITLGDTDGTGLTRTTSHLTVKDSIFENCNVGIHDYGTLLSDMAASDNNIFRTHASASPSMATNDSTFITWTTWTTVDGFDIHSTATNPNLTSNYLIPDITSSAHNLGANLTGIAPAAWDNGAPQTFGAGGSCGTGCVLRAASGPVDAGAYPLVLATPIAGLSPSTLTYSSQLVGTTSTSQAATLSNTGGAALAITLVSTSGDFAQTNTCGSSLAASGTCTITVTFTPTTSGTRTGTLTVTDNSGGTPGVSQTVSLTGTGTAATATAGLSPTGLIFGSVVVGAGSASENIALNNTGTGPLTIASIVTTGDFAQSNTCGSSLAATASCTIAVTFMPTVAGTRNGLLTVTDNSGGIIGSTQIATLTGTGRSITGPALRIAVHSLGGGHDLDKPALVDIIPPVTAITVPINGATVSGTTTVTATDTDAVGVVTLQFLIDGVLYQSITSPASPVSINWNTTTYINGSHTLQTQAIDAAGNSGSSATITVTVTNGTTNTGTFYAALPTVWVNDAECNPPGGTYDVEIVLGTTNNIGPNIAGGPTSSPYPLTVLGLRDAMSNWRDNADAAGGAAHFSDKWWRIKIPAGTVLHGTVFDSNNALLTLPGKVNPSGNTEPAKCLVVESSTPLTVGQMACGHGLPGFGGARNPGCSSPNDKASMWKFQMDSTGPVAGHAGIFAGPDTTNPLGVSGTCRSQTCTPYTNHVVLRDVEITMAPGADPYAQGVKAPILFQADNGQASFPPKLWSTHIGLDRYYIHGWDPGDPGQPTTGSHVNAVTGACLLWDNTGTVNTVNAGSAGTITWASGTHFGPTFTVGATIWIPYGGDPTNPGAGGAIGYLISAFDPTTSNTVLTVAGLPGTQTGAAYFLENPPSQYAHGCGDDLERAIDFQCDNCWLVNGYVEKVHWFQESQAVFYGFSNGPEKMVNNWFEGGSETLFSGGGPVDTGGGPVGDMEIRRNYIGKDLNWRFLSATAGNSPSPPWGCGTFVTGSPTQETCPFSYSLKNDLEMKLGHRLVVDGNIIENSWPDGQSGYCILLTVRTCSGGSVCGIFDPVTGLPRTSIDNIRFSNNWVRNCAQPVEMSNRSQKPTDGGGNGSPIENEDFVNNLFTNISDNNQFGNPGGTGPNNWQWTDGNNPYICTMSGTGALATATCVPFQSDVKAKITKISSVPNALISIPPSVATSTPANPWNNLAQAFDGNLATAATGIDSAAGMTPTTAVFSGFLTPPSTATPTSLNINLQTGQGALVVGTFAFKYSLDGGVTFTTIPGTPTTGSNAATTYTVALAPTQDITKVQVSALSSYASGSAGVVTASVYEVWISASNGALVTAVSNVRTDPMLCQTTPATCVALGQTTVIGGAAGWNGSFAIMGTSGNWAADGTGGSNITWLDTTNPLTTQTLCNNSGTPTCTSLGLTLTLASLGFKMTDIAVGDGVYAINNGADTSCTTRGYAAGATSSVYAVTGTITTGLTVVYPSTGTGVATCILNNGVGFPKNTTFHNNTILAVNKFAIVGFNTWWQPINNQFWDNVFANNDSGHLSDFDCSSQSTEGSPSFLCWDPRSFQFYHNVLTGRSAANWNIENCPSGATCPNSFPASVNCATATADTTCVGYSGFMGPTPTISYPTTSCADASAPFNCAMMALPWANNVTLSNFTYAGSSLYSTQGVDTTKLNTGMTQTEYVCPTGATCGTHGPYPD